MNTDISNEELVALYGPLKPINRIREGTLLRMGMVARILTIHGEDSEESEDGYRMRASVGHSIVNVECLFETTKPMPMELEINDFWFDDTIEAP